MGDIYLGVGWLPAPSPAPMRTTLPPYLLLLGSFPLGTFLVAQRHHPPQLLVLTPAGGDPQVSRENPPRGDPILSLPATLT